MRLPDCLAVLLDPVVASEEGVLEGVDEDMCLLSSCCINRDRQSCNCLLRSLHLKRLKPGDVSDKKNGRKPPCSEKYPEDLDAGIDCHTGLQVGTSGVEGC